jgi:hypothetical protein
LVLDRAYVEGATVRAARAARVRRSITEAFLQGDLVGGYRDQHGYVQETPEAWWNTEDLAERFESGGIFPSDPFRTQRSNLSRGRFAPLYVTSDSLAVYVGQLTGPEDTEIPAWWPGPEAKVTHWCTQEAVEAAARERLRARGNLGPLESHVCGELADMWNKARPDKPTNKASIKTTRANSR